MNMQPGYVCTDDEWERYQNNDTTIYCLSRGESIGLMVRDQPSVLDLSLIGPSQITAECGLLSLLAVGYVFAVIFVRKLPLTRTPPIRSHTFLSGTSLATSTIRAGRPLNGASSRKPWTSLWSTPSPLPSHVPR